VISKAGSSGRNWHSVLSGVAWGLSTMAFVIAGVCLSYATVVQVDRLTRVSAPKPPEVASDVIVRNAKDQQGRRASFRVLLFTDEFRWRMNSFDQLDRGNRPKFTPDSAILRTAFVPLAAVFTDAPGWV